MNNEIKFISKREGESKNLENSRIYKEFKMVFRTMKKDVAEKGSY